MITFRIFKQGAFFREQALVGKSIRIGFSPDAHVPLDAADSPIGGMIRLYSGDDGQYYLQAMDVPNAFTFDEEPIGKLAYRLQRNGELESHPYQIHVELFPDEDDFDDMMDDEPTRAEGGEDAFPFSSPLEREGAVDPFSGLAVEPETEAEPESVSIPDVVPEPAPDPMDSMPDASDDEAESDTTPGQPPEGTSKHDTEELSEGLGLLGRAFPPLVSLLADESVSEILVNGPEEIVVERDGVLVPVPACFTSEAELEAACAKLGRQFGEPFDVAYPQLELRLPGGARIHALRAPLSTVGTVLAIRKLSTSRMLPEPLLACGSLRQADIDLLKTMVRLRLNILVSGACSSGKTSVLGLLASWIPGQERTLLVEAARELRPPPGHVVCLAAQAPNARGLGEVGTADLLRSSLGLRPDRLMVGELDRNLVGDYLRALNDGVQGSMATIRANHPLDALHRLEAGLMMNEPRMPIEALRAYVAAGVEAVVHTARLEDGSRKITHITEVSGTINGEYRMKDVVRFEVTSVNEAGQVIGAHQATGYRPEFADRAMDAWLPVDDAWFVAPPTDS